VVKHVLAARAALESAVSADPQDYKSHVLLGQVLLSLGRREEAKKHLETALAIEPRGTIADVARQYLAKIGS
jgi:Tfp pilus assembly protein PilF